MKLVTVLGSVPRQDDWQSADTLLGQYNQRPEISIPVEQKGEKPQGGAILRLREMNLEI